MQYLDELISIVNPQRIQSLKKPFFDVDTQTGRLYESIVSGAIENDADGAAFFYGQQHENY